MPRRPGQKSRRNDDQLTWPRRGVDNTGTGGFSIASISGALVPAAAWFDTGITVALNGEGSFVVTPSAGFNNWDYSSASIYWNNDVLANQNPATATGGISLSTLLGGGGAYVSTADFDTSFGQVTAQFDKGGGFVWPMSVGFTDWDGGGTASGSAQVFVTLNH